MRLPRLQYHNLTPSDSAGYARLVANVLVYAELQEGRVSQSSLGALGEARRIGTGVGATVYALLPCAELPSYGEDDHIAVLARYGADKVIVLCGAGLGGSPLFVTHGPAVLRACDELPPALLLFPTSPGACDLAPRVASRLGAAFAATAVIELDAGGLQLRRPVFGGLGERRLAIDELERPVVLTWDGPPAQVVQQSEAEVIVLRPPPVQPALELLAGGPTADTFEPQPSVGLLVGEAEVPAPVRAGLFAMGVEVVAGAPPLERPLPALRVAVQSDPDDPVFEHASLGVLGAPAAIAEHLLRELGDA
jgi:electron transfer flavoprotein alpha subunit